MSRSLRLITVVVTAALVGAGALTAQAAPARAVPSSSAMPTSSAAWGSNARVSADRTRVESVATALTTSAVIASVVSVYAPLPASFGPVPAACAWLSYLRYRDSAGPANAQQADRVLVAQPGAEGGAASMDSVARNTVAAAAARGRHVEFWALERRSGCLEDATGIAAGLAARNPAVAVDYYYRGKVINGRTFAGYVPDSKLGWLADLGLAQTVRDEYTLMVHELPDPGYRATRTYCGGHSLGGIITAYLAEWDFDGDPATTADAGYDQCAGYFALDTLVSTDFGLIARVSPFPGVAQLLGAGYGAVVAGLHAGIVPRTGNLPILINPEVLTLQSIAGLAADVAPTATSTVLQSLPPDFNVDVLRRLLLSKDLLSYVLGIPDVTKFRFTNQALLGALMDDNSQPVTILKVADGMFTGGPLAAKQFPLPANAGSLPLVGDLLGLISDTTDLAVPTSTSAVYGWHDYDRITAADAPFTTPRAEVTDIQELARSTVAPLGFTDQYFPIRLLVDCFVGATQPSVAAPGALHPDGVARHATLTITGSEGLFSHGNPIGFPLPAGAVVLPGYHHLDVVTAAAKQNDGRPEQVSTRLAAFVLR